MGVLTKDESSLIYIARTAAYMAVWNAECGSQVENAVSIAMRAARDAVRPIEDCEDLLRAAVWDAIWTVADGDDWAGVHFGISRGISWSMCVAMAEFNVTEYTGQLNAPPARARARGWMGIIDTRTYRAWVESAADT